MPYTLPIFLHSHYTALLVLCFCAAQTLVVGDWPPLHKAAFEGDLVTAKILVSSGALLNQKDFKFVCIVLI
jgi:hypothetical protein